MTLRLDNVTLTYPDGDSRLVAMSSVSFDVSAGELVAVTGPSGSGKSSLLAVAGLLLTPDSGRVLIGGLDAGPLPRKDQAILRREQLGFVFQQSNLLASLTAYEQLQAAAHLAGTNGAATDQRARELLALMGLESAKARRPAQLSGGQRQRVGIARALMNNPSVLLVDEPTSALDAERGHLIVELLARVTHEQGVAAIMVTHDAVHLGLADRVSEMHDGVLTEPSPVLVG